MKWLINYIRDCFCKHDWHVEESFATQTSDWGGRAQGVKVYQRCKKCGKHDNHWKYNSN